MSEEEQDVKDIIAENLVRFRSKAGLTQLQLAEMLNYSDKAVSKWERAESIPDIRVLVQIAGIYNIKLDDLVTKPTEKEVKPVLHKTRRLILITALAVVLVWFVATGIFVLLNFIPSVNYEYLVFIVATFASSVVLMVFSAIWGNRVTNAIASTLILWTLAVNIYVLMATFTGINNLWLIFVAASPFEVLIILWFIFRKVK
ncbi:MAG: helix-turn-helix domain-containing protein [Clostridia bacterium]|nr:helix-turn-helix domain-containing protein [Clostridia bacterium]